MAIQQLIEISLESEAICTFLKDYSSQVYDAGFDTGLWIDSEGYLDTDLRQEMGSPDVSEISLFTNVIRKYNVYERIVDPETSDVTYMQLTVGKTVTVVEHFLRIEFYAVLLVSEGLQPEAHAAIEAAFVNYKMGEDFNVIETSLIQNGISTSDYQVVSAFRLLRTREPSIDKSRDDLFYSVTEGNETHSYSLRPVSNVETCELTDFDIDQSGHVVPVNNVEDAYELENYALTVGANVDCGGLVETRHRIGTAFQYPETKWVWGWNRVKIGRCWTRMYYPKVQRRTRKEALYALVLSPNDIKYYYENVFQECMRNAAITGGILLLYTGGDFETALGAFKISITDCLKGKIADTFRECVIPDLVIATEHDEWQPPL